MQSNQSRICFSDLNPNQSKLKCILQLHTHFYCPSLECLNELKTQKLLKKFTKNSEPCQKFIFVLFFRNKKTYSSEECFFLLSHIVCLYVKYHSFQKKIHYVTEYYNTHLGGFCKLSGKMILVLSFLFVFARKLIL